MKRYVIRDSEAGNIIESFDNLADAKLQLQQYEAQDKNDGIYEKGFYEIYDNEEEKIS